MPIVFGTDTGVSAHGDNAQEFALMVKAGMPEMEAIQSATSIAASFLDIADTHGSIEANKQADIIAVSGSVTVLHGGAYHPAGTGIAYSTDLGVTWKYMEQTVDNMPSLWSCSNYTYDSLFFNTKAECEEDCLSCNGESASCARIYDWISWGNQDNIVHLSVTTPINNVSYDLDIQGNYIYSTSWAGGLRRFNYTLNNLKHSVDVIVYPSFKHHLHTN